MAGGMRGGLKTLLRCKFIDDFFIVSWPHSATFLLSLASRRKLDVGPHAGWNSRQYLIGLLPETPSEVGPWRPDPTCICKIHPSREWLIDQKYHGNFLPNIFAFLGEGVQNICFAPPCLSLDQINMCWLLLVEAQAAPVSHHLFLSHRLSVTSPPLPWRIPVLHSKWRNSQRS